MSSIRFNCPNCRAKLSAEPDQYGAPASCPECRWSFYVPFLEGDNNRDALVKFFCPHCSRKLSATKEQFATELPCPFQDCQKPVLVPRPEWKPVPTTLLRSGKAEISRLVKEGVAINRPAKPFDEEEESEGAGEVGAETPE